MKDDELPLETTRDTRREASIYRTLDRELLRSGQKFVKWTRLSVGSESLLGHRHVYNWPASRCRHSGSHVSGRIPPGNIHVTNACLVFGQAAHPKLKLPPVSKLFYFFIKDYMKKDATVLGGPERT